jgi:hypothetical protein
MVEQELDPRVPRCTRHVYDITPVECGDDLAYGTIAQQCDVTGCVQFERAVSIQEVV